MREESTNLRTAAVPTTIPGRALALLGRLRDNWIVVVPLAVAAYLILIPVIYLLMLSFHSGTIVSPGEWTLNNYIRAIHNKAFLGALRNTIFIAGVGSLGTVSISFFFAYLIERTDVRWRNLVWIALLLPAAIPGLFKTLGLTLALDPNTGWINLAVRALLELFGIELMRGPFNIYSMGGLFFLDILHGSLVVFFMLVGPLRMMDPALEEASSVAGVNYSGTLRRVTIPILFPALLAAYIYAFISSMESFESALVAGLPAHIFLLSTVIYYVVVVQAPIDYALGAAFSVLYMAVMLLLILYYQRAVGVGQRYAIITGKGYKPKRRSLGRWQWLALGFVVVYIGLHLVLPATVLLYASLLARLQPFSLAAFHSMSLGVYREVMTQPGFVSDTINTLLLAFGAPTIAMVLALVVSWIIVRRRNLLQRTLLDTLVFLPHAVPGVVLSIALIIVYLTPPFRYARINGTLVIIIVALVTSLLPLTTRIMNGAVIQIHRELEEACYVSGARRFTAVVRVVLPLLMPAFAGGWVLAAAISMKAFSAPLLLGTRKSQVLAVRMWNYWDQGAIPQMAAVGVIFVLMSAPIAVLARRLVMHFGHFQR
jgi:iron(III) transport system permease protein